MICNFYVCNVIAFCICQYTFLESKQHNPDEVVMIMIAFASQGISAGILFISILINRKLKLELLIMMMIMHIMIKRRKKYNKILTIIMLPTEEGEK